MEPTIRKLRISTLKAQMERCRITLASVEDELNQPDITPDKRIEIQRQLESVARDCDAARLKVEMLEADLKPAHV
jgi:hypothetical protein